MDKNVYNCRSCEGKGYYIYFESDGYIDRGKCPSCIGAETPRARRVELEWENGVPKIVKEEFE